MDRPINTADERRRVIREIFWEGEENAENTAGERRRVIREIMREGEENAENESSSTTKLRTLFSLLKRIK